MNKLQKYLCAAIVVLVLAGIGWQYIGWQKQVARHENALQFWRVEVPKIQAEFPEFKPQNAEQMIAEENAKFAEQKKSPYVNSGIIVFLGLLASGTVIYAPAVIARLELESDPKGAAKKKR